MSSSPDSPETAVAEDITRTRTSVAAAREAGVEGEARPTSPLLAPRVPTNIGKYRVTGYLGRGGMGVVVAARDTELQRSVALKLLAPGRWGDAASLRIEREAQAMAKLAHPNVVTVYEIRRDPDNPFIAMELVTGVTLREWLRTGDHSWRRKLAMLVASGRGLAAAHAAGLVHRDFKPENVLVGADERPRVSDFGLVASTVVDAVEGEAQDGASIVAGTPAYMAPEQWAGRDVDARADQFAFAVTCWEALWGQRPFASRGLVDARGSTAAREPERLRSRRGVPRRIEVALRRALHSDREMRWAKLTDLLDRLDRLGRDKRPAIALISFLTVALLVAGLAFARSRSGEDVVTACRAAGDDVTEVWSAERQRTLSAAFTSRPEPFARETWTDVQRSIDEWVADYRGLRSQACQAKRSGAPVAEDVATARAGCLDRRRLELGALLAGLAQPDATTIRYARAAARGLTRPTACLGAQTDGPVVTEAPLAARDQLGGLRARLVESSTRRALGKPREAVALAEAVAKEADALGWAPIIAESQLELGLAYQAANSNAEGEKAHARAALQADAAQDDETRFAAMIGLADAGMDHSEYDEAGKAIETARMIARRLPPDVRRDVTIELQESLLSFWRGDYAGCVQRSKATLERVKGVFGPEALDGIVLREKLAHCLHKMGELEEASAIALEAIAIADRSTGREHPVVADVLFMQGYQAYGMGRFDEAIRYFRDALGIRERTLGPDNPVVGLSLTGLGDVLANVGELREARGHLERARAIIEPTWGSDSPALAIAERLLGEVAMALQEYDAAEKHYRRAFEIMLAKRPPGHDERTFSMADLGRALLAKGDRSAVKILQEALDAFAASPSIPPQYVATVRLDLGRALLAFDDRRRAMTMIKEACALIEATPGMTYDQRQCRQLLR